MIKYNGNNAINDWNYGTSNLIKVYRNGSVCYQKMESGSTPPTPPSRLPSGYTEVEYIENTSMAYIDSGVYLNTSNFEVGCEVVDTYCLWGYCHQNVVNGTWLSIECTSVQNTAFYGKYGSSYMVDMSSYMTSSGNTFVYTQSGVTVNGATISKSLTMGSDSIANKSLLFFGRYDFNANSVEWQNTNSKFKSFYVKNNGTLVRDFVPALRDSDSKYGLYDLVTNTFYLSPNGNEFSGGSPV